MSLNGLFCMLFAILLFIPACSRTEEDQPHPIKQVPQIEEIKPEKPAKIKLKRDAKEGYSWEISGDNVDEIIKADQRLRKTLKSE